MRRLLPLALLAPLAALQPAHAQSWNSRCTQDYFGNIRCSASDGSSLRITEDYFGTLRGTFTDGYGRSTNCRTTRDYFGTIRTSCY